MSSLYSDFIYTNFPDQPYDTYEYMQDMNSDLLNLVSQYESLINAKKFNEASQLLIDNPSLNRIYFNAEKYNRLVDSIRATQRLYSNDVQTYILELVKNKGSYSNTQKYTKYNVVEYNSQIYMCTSLDCPLGTLPTDNLYWYPLSIKGDTGEKGDDGLGLHFSGGWSASITYSKDAAVSYGTCLYASNQDDNLGRTPSKTSSYWTLVIDFNTVTAYDNSSSGSTETTMQNAIDDLYSITNNNKNNINNNTSSINTINTKLNTVEQGAQKNTVTGVKGNSESSYRTGNINITKANIGLGNVDNTADSQKSVKNADTVDGVHFHPNDASGAPSGFGYVYGFNGGDDLNAWVFPTNQMSVNYANSAGTASSCSGNAATATNADTVDGFHFKISTTDLTAGSSSLTKNTFYFVYE